MEGSPSTSGASPDLGYPAEPEMLQHPSYTWEETKWAKEKREEANG